MPDRIFELSRSCEHHAHDNCSWLDCWCDCHLPKGSVRVKREWDEDKDRVWYDLFREENETK